MAKKQKGHVASKGNESGKAAVSALPTVAATLTGVIYQARLLNRQSKLNIPESEVISDVVTLWRTVMDIVGGSSR